jgi:hypothetical protein
VQSLVFITNRTPSTKMVPPGTSDRRISRSMALVNVGMASVVVPSVSHRRQAAMVVDSSQPAGA